MCVYGWEELQNILEERMGFSDENEDMGFSLAIHLHSTSGSQTFLEVSLDRLVTHVQRRVGLMAGAE